MPVVGILLAVVAALGLGSRAMWVWLARERNGVTQRRRTLGTVAIGSVLSNWLWFVATLISGEVGGFGTH